MLTLTMICSMFVSVVPVTAVGDIKIMGISIVDSGNVAITDDVTLSISVNDDAGVETTITGGFGNPAMTKLAVGDTITVEITSVPEGYKIPGTITLTAGTNSSNGVYNYVYNGESVDPVHSLTITLEKANTTYDVILPGADIFTIGTIATSADKAAEGDTVNITITLNEGYTNEDLSVYYIEADSEDKALCSLTSSNADTRTYVYSFTMPANSVYITPEYGSSSGSEGHIHAICGETTCETDHNLDGGADGLAEVEYTALSEAMANYYDSESDTYKGHIVERVFVDGTIGYRNTYSAYLTGGNYYLDKDITLSSTLAISGDIKLCLNGHKLALADNATTGSVIYNLQKEATLTLADCNGDNGSFKFTQGEQQWVLSDSGEHTVTGGVITGARESSGNSDHVYLNYAHAIYLSGSGTFNMYGGNIVGNNNAGSTGSAISVSGNAFHMYDGTVQGNYGGAANVLSDTNETVIYGGLIAYNISSDADKAAGLQFANNVTILGGEIRDNTGIGMQLTAYGKTVFSIQGGSFTGNTSGGIIVYDYAFGGTDNPTKVILGGSADKELKIENNTGYNFKMGDENFGGYIIEVGELAENSAIGIASAIAPTAGSPVTISSTGAAYLANFTSDDATYRVARDTTKTGLVLKVDDPTLRDVTITEGIENGTVTTDKATAKEDDEVTLTVTPADGYITDSLTVTDENSNEIAVERVNGTEYTFTMPLAAVTVNATFAELTAHEHPECGTECDGDCGGTHGNVTWTALTQAGMEGKINALGSIDSMPDYSYLAEDVVLESIQIMNSGNKYICLNGNDLTIKNISSNGTLYLCDCVGGGKLSGNSDVAEIGWGSLLEMYSGTIEARDGQALVVDYSKASVYGGTITSNSAEAINVTSGNTIKLSGNLTVSGQEADIVLADSAYITIGGTISTDEPIVISAGEGDFTSGWSTYMANAEPAEYFVTTEPDKWAVELNTETNELQVVGIPQDVTVDSAIANGTITVDPSGAVVGDTVTIVAKPDSGFVLDEITVTDKDGNTVQITQDSEDENKYTFVMPETEVTVGATFAALYPVTIGGEIENGTVTADVSEAAEGDTVTLTLTPDATYEFAAITVTDANGNTVTTTDSSVATFALSEPVVKTFTFAMPASEVTVDATFTRMTIDSPFTVTATPDKTQVVAGEEVKVAVVVSGSAFTSADWTMIYDSSKFELTNTEFASGASAVNAGDNVLAGKISGGAGSTTGDEFADGTAVVTYTFTAIAQSSDTTVKFDIIEAHADTYEMSLIQDLTPAQTIVDCEVIIALESATAAGSFEAKTVEYNGLDQQGNPFVLDKAYEGSHVTITYSTEENGTYRTELPYFKAVGTHTYWVKIDGIGTDNKLSTTLTITPRSVEPTAVFEVDPDVNRVVITPVIENVIDDTLEGTITVTVGDTPYTFDASKFEFDGTSAAICTESITLSDQTGGELVAEVAFVAAENANYLDGSGTASVDVDKVTADDATIQALKATITSEFPYDGDPHSVIVADTLPTGWSVKSITDAYDSTIADPTVTNVGEDKLVKVTFEDTTLNKYNEVNIYVILKVTPVEVTITVDDAAKAYGAADPTFTSSISPAVTDGTFGDIVLVREPGEKSGTYTITASYTPNDNYKVTVVPGKLTIGAPEYVIEVVDLKLKTGGDASPDYIAGYRMVLVYTNGAQAYFTYDGKNMYDVRNANYTYVDNDYAAGTATESTVDYKYVYAMVTQADTAYEGDLQTVEDYYANKVDFAGSDSEYAPKMITYDADINLTGNLDGNDFSITNGIYNVLYSPVGDYMESILKADYNHDKVVDTSDAIAVKDAIAE